MRRFLLFLIALVLPLQFTWGAATAYCQHETGAAAGRHFGHHQHVHKAEHGKQADTAKWTQDNDCGTCHAAGLAALTGTLAAPALLTASQAVAVAPGHPPLSPPPKAPERPRWSRLA